MHYRQYRYFDASVYLIIIGFISAISSQNLCYAQVQLNDGDIPDVHFWTNDRGIPQFDFRVPSLIIGYRGKELRYLQYPNRYGSAINRGDWRGVNMLLIGKGAYENCGAITDCKLIYPPSFADERGVMLDEDSFARSGRTPNINIETEGSGIIWGTIKPHKGDWFENRYLHGPYHGQSALLGPVCLTGNYIRFDGPVSCIGEDVELRARRIVVNGIDLPPDHWRSALQLLRDQHQQSTMTPYQQSNLNQTTASNPAASPSASDPATINPVTSNPSASNPVTSNPTASPTANNPAMSSPPKPTTSNE